MAFNLARGGFDPNALAEGIAAGQRSAFQQRQLDAEMFARTGMTDTQRQLAQKVSGEFGQFRDKSLAEKMAQQMQIEPTAQPANRLDSEQPAYMSGQPPRLKPLQGNIQQGPDEGKLRSEFLKTRTPEEREAMDAMAKYRESLGKANEYRRESLDLRKQAIANTTARTNAQLEMNRERLSRAGNPAEQRWYSLIERELERKNRTETNVYIDDDDKESIIQEIDRRIAEYERNVKPTVPQPAKSGNPLGLTPPPSK